MMEDNIDFYFQVRSEFENKILSMISYRDLCNEWSLQEDMKKGTLSFYQRILHCECFDGGFLGEDAYHFVSELLENLYYLEDCTFLKELNSHREDISYREKLSSSLYLLRQGSEVLREAFGDR